VPDAAAGPVPATLPQDLEDILMQLAACERDAEAILRDLDEQRLNWRPAAASWSIGQCIDHLAAASRVQLAVMAEGAESARRRGWSRRGPIQPGPPSRWFIRNLEPPPRQRLRAPKQIVPAERLAPEAVGGEFARRQAEIRSLLRAVAGLDLNRARYVNPFVPFIRFSLGTGFLVLAAHQRRHLWQAARLRQHADFP